MARTRLMAAATLALLVPLGVLADPADHPAPDLSRPYRDLGPLPLDLRPVPLAAPGPGQGPLEFVCAKPGDGSTGYNVGSANAIYGCPIRVYDFTPGGNNLSPFGNIQLAVQKSDPSKAAFFSLHGQAADGPTNRSRGGNTHTTFSTPDMGLSWTDSWTTRCPDDSALGEGASGSMDEGGNVTVAYTWSRGNGGLFHVYKMGTVEDDRSFMGQYCSGAEWEVATTGRTTATHVVSVPPDGTANGSPSASDATIHGTRDATVVVWHEAAATTTGSDLTAADGTVRFAASFVPGNDDSAWLASPSGSRIDGCVDASNPVVWDGKVWVACVVGPSYGARRAIPGDIDLWSLAPGNGTPEFVSFTRLQGPNPRLAVTSDGYFAIFATHVKSEQEVLVPYTMGWHGRQWTSPRDLGPQLHALLGNVPVLSAHVTAAVLIDQGRTVYLVYKEWNRLDADVDRLLAPPDLANPTAPRLADHKKVIVTLDECKAPVAASEFALGLTPEVYQQPGITNRPQLFDDQFDGLQAVRMPQGEEWVFFAVNDYGAAQFGAIRGPSGVSGEVCSFAPPLPTPPLPAIPQALTVANPATFAVGAAVGTAAAAMVTYLLLSRRKVAQHVAAEDR